MRSLHLLITHSCSMHKKLRLFAKKLQIHNLNKVEIMTDFSIRQALVTTNMVVIQFNWVIIIPDKIRIVHILLVRSSNYQDSYINQCVFSPLKVDAMMNITIIFYHIIFMNSLSWLEVKLLLFYRSLFTIKYPLK